MRVSKTKKVLGISTVIITVILLHRVGLLTPIEELFRSTIAPGSKTLYQWSITVGDDTTSFSSVEELQDAYASLKTDVVANTIDAAEIFFLEEENKELREQLAFFSSTTFTHVGAEVIGKNIEPLGSTLVIDKGEDRGVTVGNPVIVHKGVLVGTIVQVYKNTAIVKLLNDNQSKIAATIANADRSIGLVEGGYGISVRMNFIPQNEQIFVGDIIVTSGLTKNIPKGLLIGKIESVEKEAYQPFQEAIVTPSVDLNKINIVSVITQS